MKKAIITIHGMGEQAAGYSNEFEEMLRTQFEKIKQKNMICRDNS